MKKTFKLKRVWAIMLALAFVFASIPTPTFAAAKGGKVQQVTKVKDSDGNTITFKYNKKGLVSKAVKKMSYKTSDSDVSYTRTTTYKYNKKRRISKKTSVKTEKVTNYETDKTTGKQIKGTTGTVTTTTKSVTTYKYNKKGLATSSVETTTITKSGSETVKEISRNYGYRLEKKDGKYVAGYNDSNNKAGSEYYVTGDFAKATENRVSTTTYKDNGNGTYTKSSDTTYDDQNYEYSYIGSDGKSYDDPDEAPYGVKMIEKRITINNSNKYYENYKSQYLCADKTVTTKTYKYDSKKRVKSVATTTVNTTSSDRTAYSNTDTTFKPDGTKTTYSEVDNTKISNVTTDTTNNTEKYTYKKGLAKKYTYSDKGIKNSTDVYTRGLSNYTETYSDGTVKKVTGSGADWALQETTTTANGTRTEKIEEKPYKITEVTGGSTYTYDVPADPVKTTTKAVKAEPSSDTYTYKYDKQKNVASYKYSGTSVEWKNQQDETFGNTLYEGYDQDQEPVAAEVSVTHTYSGNGKNENAVKKGTTALKKTLTMVSGQKSDRETTPGYSCSRVTYTLKAKSFSKKLKPDVQAQQWSIQNGALNGFVGLSIGF